VVLGVGTTGRDDARVSSQDVDYAAVVAIVRAASGEMDVAALAGALVQAWTAVYQSAAPRCELVEFEEAGATFLFDLVEPSGGDRPSRTVAAHALSQPAGKLRDVAYQRGYPDPAGRATRALDKGHMVPHAAGGLFGPNIFPQDRALNRGWSLEGRRYRAMEREAAAAPSTFFFCRLIYSDDSEFPAEVELGLLRASDLVVERFRNRFDTDAQENAVGGELARLRGVLAAATSGQIGDLGEETVAVFLEEELDATIVALGDAGMPRRHGLQDLDVVAVVDGELVVFEVKTRFFGRSAGYLTRAGNLPRPRLRRQRSGHQMPRKRGSQGSQPYAAVRLDGIVDVDEDHYGGVQARAVAVDLRSLTLQQFAVDDSGGVIAPLGVPVDCSRAAATALERIVEHRGHV
jgi:hypothetical protein